MSDLRCERCHGEVDVDWLDTTTVGGEPSRLPGDLTCLTPGCVGPGGTAATRPIPSPAELLARADRSWMDHQRQLAGEAW